MSGQAGNISISDYSYDLPESKIAAFPNEMRSASKLLVYKGGDISAGPFSNLPNILLDNSVLLFNDTKVITARLFFKNKLGQNIEVFCLGPLAHVDPQEALQTRATVQWTCMVGHLKKWKEEALVLHLGNIALKVTRIGETEGAQILNFEWQPADLRFYDILNQFGALPIPPYLKRKSNEEDAVRYQTVYAKNEGSVAAPTAGLHFTETVLNDLKHKGVDTIRMTLHVGAGTFKPVKAAKMKDHHMHSEWMHVSLEQLDLIRAALAKELICVGTTSLRALESLYWMGLKCFVNPDIRLNDLEIKQWEVYEKDLPLLSPEQSLEALRDWLLAGGLNYVACCTQILIAPPYKLKMAKGLITNFHQPQSTLLLLVAAVLGEDWRKVYDYALNNDFKFLSYGDASLLLK